MENKVEQEARPEVKKEKAPRAEKKIDRNARAEKESFALFVLYNVALVFLVIAGIIGTYVCIGEGNIHNSGVGYDVAFPEAVLATAGLATALSWGMAIAFVGVYYKFIKLIKHKDVGQVEDERKLTFGLFGTFAGVGLAIFILSIIANALLTDYNVLDPDGFNKIGIFQAAIAGSIISGFVFAVSVSTIVLGALLQKNAIEINDSKIAPVEENKKEEKKVIDEAKQEVKDEPKKEIEEQPKEEPNEAKAEEKKPVAKPKKTKSKK